MDLLLFIFKQGFHNEGRQFFQILIAKMIRLEANFRTMNANGIHCLRGFHVKIPIIIQIVMEQIQAIELFIGKGGEVGLEFRAGGWIFTYRA